MGATESETPWEVGLNLGMGLLWRGLGGFLTHSFAKIPILLKLNTEDKYKHTHNITMKRLPSLSGRTKFHITAYFGKYPKKLNCDELIN